MLKLTRFIIILSFMVFVSTGCTESNNDKQYYGELQELKKEIAILKDCLINNEQMQIEINSLKEEIDDLKNNNKDMNIEASVYSYIIGEKDIEMTIDFKKENSEDRKINFFVLSGNIKNQSISGGHNVIKYDDVIVPGKGTLSFDDLPKDIKRYRIVFPLRADYVYYIIAIDEKTGSIWKHEINSCMESDI